MPTELEPAEIDVTMLRRVFDEAPDGMIVIDGDGLIQATNKAAEHLTGYAREELATMSVEDLVPIEARQRHFDQRLTAQRNEVERPMSAVQTLAVARRDGTLLPVDIALTTIGDGNGWYLASVRDVSERVLISDRLNLSEEVLLLAQERERIARDLHDTVLQRLFGLGLEVQAIGMRAEPALAERLDTIVGEIDRVIREVRTAVFTLGAAHREGSFGQELGLIVAQASRLLRFTPHLEIEGPLEAVITPEIRSELVATMREALSNVARHSGATEAAISLTAGDWVELRITDNGRGLVDPQRVERGNGMRNMRQRAELLGGSSRVDNGPDQGAVVTWRVPAHRRATRDQRP